MPLFRDHKVLFIHVPKCGGTSMEKAFFEREDGTSGLGKHNLMAEHKPEWLERKDIKLTHQGAKQHLRYSEILKLGIFKSHDDLKNNWTSFSFVRDPWDRFMSAIFFLHRKLRYPRAMEKCRTKKEVVRLVKSMAYGPDGVFFHGWSWEEFCANKDHFRTQKSLVTHNGEVAVDFLGRYENLNKDFNKFLVKFDLNKKFYHIRKKNGKKTKIAYAHDFSEAPNFVVPREIPKNGGRTATNCFSAFKSHFADMGIKRYKDLYDDELREVVETTYAEDIEYFDYVF